MRRMSGQNIYLAAVLIGSGLLIGYLFLFYGSDPELAARGPRTLAQIPFDGTAAYKNLVALCDLGSRRSGTEGMDKQQKLITDHFEKLGGKVERQEFRVRHPLDGSAVTMTNLIVHWHPERRERLLVCAHYDTRPYPDRDAKNPRGLFVGANDGASGAALMMELGRAMPAMAGPIGVDFVLFDGEELVYGDNDEYFLGAKYFAQQYASQPPPYRYRAGVLLDMVGDVSLRLQYEPNSVRFAPADRARDLGHGLPAGRPRVRAADDEPGRERRPYPAQRNRRHSHLRRDRLRIPLLAHDRRRTLSLFGLEPGKSRLGHPGMAQGRRHRPGRPIDSENGNKTRRHREEKLSGGKFELQEFQV